MAQSTVIEGVVRNADTKELLPYVLLRIAGTNTGAQANSEGEYRLVIPQSHADADIIVSCAGYQAETVPAKKLKKKKDIKLKPMSVVLSGALVTEYGSPSSLMKDVVQRIPENYWCDTTVGTFFYRHYGMVADSLWLFCEAISNVMRPGYDKQYTKKTMPLYDSILNVKGNNKEFPLGRLLVFDIDMLSEMLGGDSVLENASLVGVLQTNYFDANAFSDLLQKCHAGCQDVGKAGFGSGCLQQQYLPCGR